jgi:hypothetical protein
MDRNKRGLVPCPLALRSDEGPVLRKMSFVGAGQTVTHPSSEHRNLAADEPNSSSSKSSRRVVGVERDRRVNPGEQSVEPSVDGYGRVLKNR